MAGLLLTGAALTACTGEEIAGMEEQPISFGTYIGNPAVGRGYPYGTDNLPSMGVYAFYTGQSKWADWTGDKSTPNFMNNQLVNRIFDDNGVATGWEYSPVKYWPTMQNDKLTFFAYAPYHYLDGNGNKKPINAEWKDGEIVIHYEYYYETDLLYTTNQEATTDLTRQSLDGKVQFDFNHALAKIDVQVAVSADYDRENTTIEVVEIGFQGANGGHGLYESGDFYPAENSWENCIEAGLRFYWNNKSYKEDVFNNLTTEYQSILKENQIYFAIPQNFAGEKLQAGIDYKIITIDPDINNGIQQGSITTINAPRANISPNFVAGKAYAIRFLIGVNGIDVDAVETPWK